MFEIPPLLLLPLPPSNKNPPKNLARIPPEGGGGRGRIQWAHQAESKLNYKPTNTSTLNGEGGAGGAVCKWGTFHLFLLFWRIIDKCFWQETIVCGCGAVLPLADGGGTGWDRVGQGGMQGRRVKARTGRGWNREQGRGDGVTGWLGGEGSGSNDRGFSSMTFPASIHRFAALIRGKERRRDAERYLYLFLTVILPFFLPSFLLLFFFFFFFFFLFFSSSYSSPLLLLLLLLRPFPSIK